MSRHEHISLMVDFIRSTTKQYVEILKHCGWLQLLHGKDKDPKIGLKFEYKKNREIGGCSPTKKHLFSSAFCTGKKTAENKGQQYSI